MKIWVLTFCALSVASAAVAGEQILRDSHGTRLGTIQTRGDGMQIARDARGTPVGEYDPKTNTTRDAHGTRIGDGNFLSALIVCPR
jgi:hypothetical protein